MAERKLVKKIQDMIDQTDERRKLGRVNLERAQHFNINRPDLAHIDPEYDPSGRRQDTGSKKVPQKFMEWNYSAFNHDRGKYYNPDPLNWKVGPRHQQKRGSFLTDSRGNFLHSINIGNNANIKYSTVIDVSAEVTHKIRLQFMGQASVGVYVKKVGALGFIKQYTSGYNNAHNPTTAIPLKFANAGKYLITVYVYQQAQTPAIGGVRTILTGDLSSISSAPAVIAPPEVIVVFNTSAGGGTPSGGKSEFVDGSNGPTLANIVYWNRIKQDALSNEASTDFDIAGYRLLNIRYETLDYQVASGWGTNGIIVTGEKSSDFPIGLDFRIWNGTSWDDHRVSGSFYYISSETASGNAETLIITSGTGSASTGEFIQVEQSLFVQDIPYDTQTGPVVSGTHLGVKSGESYTYEVQLYDRLGNIFPRTQSISFTTGSDITAPGKVTGVTAGGGNKRVMLGWVNPSDTDIKGFNIWDTDNPTLGVNTPIKTIIKGSVNETLVTGTYISQLSDRSELQDVTSYTFYVSTFDWAGNETLTSLPNGTASTTINIKTASSGQRIETDSATNQIRFYDASDNNLITVGENIFGTTDGIELVDAMVKLTSDAFDPNDYIRFFAPDGGIVSAVTSRWAFISQIQYENNNDSYAIKSSALDGTGNYSVSRIGVHGDSFVTAGTANPEAMGLSGESQTNGGAGNSYGVYSNATVGGGGTGTAYSFYGLAGLLYNKNDFIVSGTNAVFGVNTGMTIGNPTGGNKGAGTINVSGGIYLNNSAYTNPDYVFEQDYPLMGLDELGRYVIEHKHLPGIKSNKEIKESGVEIFEANKSSLQKIEELTLYILQLHERIKVLEGKCL